MQILTLDGHNKETFRQEGDAEILELEGETEKANNENTDTDTNVQKPPRRGSLSILEEAEEDLIRSELASAEAEEAELELEFSRKESDHKGQQVNSNSKLNSGSTKVDRKCKH